MKLIYKICLVNLALVFIVAGITAMQSGSNAREYLAVAGLVSIIWSVLCAVVGLALLLFRQKLWCQGFLLSSGILLLLGFMECSAFAALS